ncbi:YidH family protein [Amycolatopsis pigmentata]|uniref:YidH family protein n=1 Tax=Amycolatopsis pigmentata TaxID=450801 RepID=A0ABW5FL87_9PSEU
MGPRWYEEGEEPDYRFTLANERTFLAWLRTALALVAGAVALSQLVPPFAVPYLRTALAVLLAVAGTVLAALSYRRWATVQRAMRQGRPLPMDWLPAIVGAVAAVAGLVVVVVVLVR